ncbi:MAG: 3-deoxy-7-phosphoheptulonate synthase [Planctomycetota bacterium]
MFILLKPGCTPEQRTRVLRTIESAGLAIEVSEGHHRIVIGVVGDEDCLRHVPIETYDGVERVVRLRRPYRLAAREIHPEDTVVSVGGADGAGRQETAATKIGTGLTIIAGPCAVEDPDRLLALAREAKDAGATILRGGAFKPRTTPYDFRGLAERGLKVLREVADEVGLPVVTEAMDPRQLETVAEHADMIQIGTRNMQNFPLLEEAARTDRPILLKRGRAATITEWLCAADYVIHAGNSRIVLCERGLVSFDDAVRNHLDLSCVPLVKRLSHLPIVVDPSHGTGRSELVSPMARAAIAAGADGIMVEVHGDPTHAKSDARQQILPDELYRLVPQLLAIREIVAQERVEVPS